MAAEWAGSNRQRVVETNGRWQPIRQSPRRYIADRGNYRRRVRFSLNMAWLNDDNCLAKVCSYFDQDRQTNWLADCATRRHRYQQPAFSIEPPAGGITLMPYCIGSATLTGWSLRAATASMHGRSAMATGRDLRRLPARNSRRSDGDRGGTRHLRGRGARRLSAEALAESLIPRVRGGRVLWVRADRGREVLPEALRQAGATIETVVVYRQVDVVQPEANITGALQEGRIDWVLLSSSNMATAFFGWLDEELAAIIKRRVRLATISPVTSETVRGHGFEVGAEATTYTIDGMVDAILACGTQTASQSPAK